MDDTNLINFSVGKINLNIKLIPPMSNVSYDLIIKNDDTVDSIIEDMEIHIKLGDIETPLKINNLFIKAGEQMSIIIERRLDFIETIDVVLKPVKLDSYKIKGKSKINDVLVNIDVKETKKG